MTEKQIDKKVYGIMKKLYPNTNIVICGDNVDLDDMARVYAPVGSLIITPESMPKKEFLDFKLRWIKSMERRIKEDGKKEIKIQRSKIDVGSKIKFLKIK